MNDHRLPSEIKIPERLGRVRAEECPPGAERLVVCLEDAHESEEAQRNLSEILGDLVESYGFGLIFVEAAAGPLRLDVPGSRIPLASFPDAGVRRKVADRWLSSGRLSAAEYLMLVTDYDEDAGDRCELFGIDDMEAHRQQILAAREVITRSEKTIAALSDLGEEVTAACLPFLSADLADYVGLRRAHAAETVQFLEYAEALAAYAAGDIGPRLAEALEIGRLEQGVNLWQVEIERTQLVDSSARFGRDPLDKLVRAQQLKAWEVPQQFSNLKRYLLIQERMAAAQELWVMEELFYEVSQVDRGVLKQLARTELDRHFTGILFLLDSVRDAVTLRVVPEDVKDLFAADLLKGIAEHLSGIRDMGVDRGGIRGGTAELSAGFAAAKRFYNLAIKRSKVFSTNVERELERRQEKGAAVVVGGFHSGALCDDLVAGNTVAIKRVAPVITRPPALPYHEVLLSDRKPISPALELLAEMVSLFRAEEKSSAAAAMKLRTYYAERFRAHTDCATVLSVIEELAMGYH